MIFGTVLVAALVAATLAWALEWALGRLGAAAWLTRIATFALLVYAFWLLLAYGPIPVGR